MDVAKDLEAGGMESELDIEEGDEESEKSASLKYSILIICVTLLTGCLVGGTIALLVLSDLDEESFNKEKFSLDSSLFLAEFQNEFNRVEKDMLQLRSFVELSYNPQSNSSSMQHPITLTQWNIYLEALAEDNNTSAPRTWSWLPRIFLKDRDEFEAYGRKLYGENFSITDFHEDGKGLVPAEEKPVYVPALYATPFIPGVTAVGFDLGSQASHRWGFDISLSKDHTVLSDPILASGGDTVVMSMVPAFSILQMPDSLERNISHFCPEREEPLLCEYLLGFIFVSMDVDKLVDIALSRSTLMNAGIIVRDLKTNSALSEDFACDSSPESSLFRTETLSMNDRYWQIEIEMCRDEEQSYSEYKWSILAIAILLTMLILVSMFLLKTNTDRTISSEKARRLAESERAIEEHNRLLAEQERKVAEAGRARAEEISQAKARFLSNMSHELRTPLNGVIGTIDILHNSLPKKILDKHAEDFETISNCAEILLSTINDILDVNKLMVGKMKLHQSFFSVEEVISTCLSTVRAAAVKKNITLTSNLSDKPRVVLSDQARVSQMILNYLSNAVKFTQRDGHVSVTLQWSPVEEGSVMRKRSRSKVDMGMSDEDVLASLEVYRAQREELFQKQGVSYHQEQIIVCVEDDGVGIEKDELRAIFQPFEQVESGVSRAFGGSGLGLSICYQLAHLLGGRVWVESTVGVGSKFYLSLPMDVVDQDSLDDLIRRTSSAGNANNRTKRLIMISTSSQKKLKEVEEKFGTLKTDRDMSSGQGDTSDRPSSEERTCEGESSTPREPSMQGRRDKRSKRAEKLKHEFAGKKVLVVEDNLLNQRVFTKYLKNAGVEVEVASNGELGVEAAAKTKFDLILMDCHMPVMDGYLASAQITQDEGCINASTPIIALTADVEASNRQSCESCGMVDFLTKPLQSNALYRLMRRYITMQSTSPIVAVE